MCGIAGIINPQVTPDATNIVRRMCDCLAHRGPDGSGIHQSSTAILGHRRLAIIDPTRGAQPITNEDGSVVAVFNGEIYNFRTLREKLEQQGHQFKTDTDSEVIVHLYEEHGSDFVRMLDGMFAFAVCNTKTHQVLLARDPLGKKPLVYFTAGKSLVFASEINALACHPGMPRQLDATAISDFLSFHYIPSPGSIYREVHKLPPGHFMEIKLEAETMQIHPYWRLNYSNKLQGMSFTDAAHELRRLVERSVEKRLMSDVPLGTFLSGGLDSTIITALTTRLRGTEETHAFTIGFEVDAYDERSWAAQAAQFINQQTNGKLRCLERVVEPCDFSLLETLAGGFGEPYADASMLPTCLLSRFAREQIKVALSGDGADEIFSGYERYIAIRYASRLDFLPNALRQRLFSIIGGCLPDRGERTFSGRLRRLLRMFACNPEERYFNLMNHFPGSMRQALFGDRLQDELRHDPIERFEQLSSELTSANPVEQVAELDVHTYLLNDILPKVDISSMSASLEVRSPFLDREVIEFAAQLPLEYKLQGQNRKRILKTAFADLVPPTLANRPKKGFGVPVAIWLRGAWREQARTNLFEGRLTQDGFIRSDALQTLWNEHQQAQADHGYPLWGLLILSMFLGKKP